MDVDDLEREHSLLTAAHRYDDLRLRHTLLGSSVDDGSDVHLPMHEALELLALGEVLTRKAAYGRQLAVRAARSAGASWSQIAQAGGVTKQSAWEAHNAWIQAQVDAHQARDHEGFTPEEEASARRLAGAPD
ncbi:hypothetical protein [Kineococcus auxinigenes]|uniref:hypothetical protein n=1 Tax=unclassified Kineococcus TaxID=2621656 RepID=UPI003D7E824C